jgi:hypothetical protein
MRGVVVRIGLNNLGVRLAIFANLMIVGLLTVLEVRGILTPRGFGIAGLAAMVICGIIWYFAAKSIGRSSAANAILASQGAKVGNRRVYLQGALFLVLTIFTATRQGPWWVKLIGPCVMLVYIYVDWRVRWVPPTHPGQT